MKHIILYNCYQQKWSVEVEVVCGGGGGRGKYAGIDGDVPLARNWRLADGNTENKNDDDARARRRSAGSQLRTDDASNIQNAIVDKNMIVIIILKNTRSLAGDVRMDELLEELVGQHWDMVCVNETWRREVEENFTLNGGHRWFGSGGERKCGGTGCKHGVGILIHARLSKAIKRVTRLSPRVMFLDVQLGSRVMRAICVYMPHSGYDDAEVQLLYDQLDAIRNEAYKRCYLLSICGDWNAEVGCQQHGQEDGAIGPFSIGIRSMRGNWFAKWAWGADLIVVNTHFDKPCEKLWTHNMNLQKMSAKSTTYAWTVCCGSGQLMPKRMMPLTWDQITEA